jgi:hypothetical protein
MLERCPCPYAINVLRLHYAPAISEWFTLVTRVSIFKEDGHEYR